MEPENWGGNSDSWELGQCFTDWMSAVPFLQGQVHGVRRCLVLDISFFGGSQQ